MRLKLPSWLEITPKNKYWVGLIGWIIASLMFAAPQRFPILEAKVLENTPFDQTIPFLPWSIWVYVSYYFQIISAYLIAQNLRNLTLFGRSFFLMQGGSVAFFFLYPTTFPRELFPLPEGLDAATLWTWQTLRVLDLPSNCLPSLHTGTALLVAMMMWYESRRLFWIYFVWAMLIAISTLTTKQHFAIDVVGGVIVATFSHWVIRRKEKGPRSAI